MKIWVCDSEGSKRFPVFTRGNAGEAYAEVATPLTWTGLGQRAWELGYRDAFYEMGVFTTEEFKPEGESELAGCFGGYVYLNMSVARVLAVRVPGLTVEAIDASFFGATPDVPPYRPDPRDQNPARTAQVSAWLAALYTTDPIALTNVDRARVEALVARRPDFTGLSDAQLLEYFRSLRPESRRLVKRHMLNTYGCNILTGLIAQLAQTAGAPHLVAKVTAGIGDIDSARQSFELWNLSRLVAASPLLSAEFQRGVAGLLGRVRNNADSVAREFLAGWNSFIDRWGFVGPNIWELRSPTYRTHPEIPLQMLERLRLAPDSSSPQARGAQLAEERAAAIARLSALLAGEAEVQRQFERAARSVGAYLAARERTKVLCTLLNEEARAPLRELGQRLVQRNLLARWEHVLLVTDAEADGFIADPRAYSALIAERAATLEMLANKEPPFVFEGDPPALSAFKDHVVCKAPALAPGLQLSGIGVSAGRHTGRARVISALEASSELEPGEVIVAATTDAAWGPLFLAAGAVVVETGSPVSHAAIVARELGIPAVVSVPSAMTRIADGAMISVDGDTGTIRAQ